MSSMPEDFAIFKEIQKCNYTTVTGWKESNIVAR